MLILGQSSMRSPIFAVLITILSGCGKIETSDDCFLPHEFMAEPLFASDTVNVSPLEGEDRLTLYARKHSVEGYISSTKDGVRIPSNGKIRFTGESYHVLPSFSALIFTPDDDDRLFVVDYLDAKYFVDAHEIQHWLAKKSMQQCIY